MPRSYSSFSRHLAHRCETRDFHRYFPPTVVAACLVNPPLLSVEKAGHVGERSLAFHQMMAETDRSHRKDIKS